MNEYAFDENGNLIEPEPIQESIKDKIDQMLANGENALNTIGSYEDSEYNKLAKDILSRFPNGEILDKLKQIYIDGNTDAMIQIAYINVIRDGIQHTMNTMKQKKNKYDEKYLKYAVTVNNGIESLNNCISNLDEIEQELFSVKQAIEFVEKLDKDMKENKG